MEEVGRCDSHSVFLILDPLLISYIVYVLTLLVRSLFGLVHTKYCHPGAGVCALRNLFGLGRGQNINNVISHSK